MADMRAMDDVPRLDVGNPNEVLESLRARAEQAQAMRDQLAEVTGEAQTDDKTVRAVVGVRGLQELVLDPKAMRMPSVDLAAAIVQITQEAGEDYARARRERVEELGAQQPGITLEESRAQLAQLSQLMSSGTADMQSIFEKMRTQFGR